MRTESISITNLIEEVRQYRKQLREAGIEVKGYQITNPYEIKYEHTI